jgi:hypothetical protein
MINQSSNRAFAQAPNRLSDSLKNTQKLLSVQELAAEDFALGASHLSWQK